MLIFNKNVSFGGRGATFNWAIFFGRIFWATFNRGKFRPGLISTGHILPTKVYHNSLVVGQGSTVGTGITGLLNTYITSNLIVFKL